MSNRSNIVRSYKHPFNITVGNRQTFGGSVCHCIPVVYNLKYTVQKCITLNRISAVFHYSYMICSITACTAIKHKVARLCGFNLHRPCFQQCISESTASRISRCVRNRHCLTGNSGNVKDEIGAPRFSAGIPSVIIVFSARLCHGNIDHIHSAVTCQCNRIKAILNAVIRTCGKRSFKRRDIVAQRCSDRSKSHYRRNNSRQCSFQLHRNLSL